MKKIIQAVAIAAALAAPIASFAQSNGSVTRAEVRHQLVQVERAGYNPARNDPSYPNDIQAAEKRANAGSVANSAGGVEFGSSQGGHAVAPSASAEQSMFSHR
jgi:Ni/Co efflux regulator RcnB